jgi:hypothetical protein
MFMVVRLSGFRCMGKDGDAGFAQREAEMPFLLRGRYRRYRKGGRAGPKGTPGGGWTPFARCWELVRRRV